VSADGTIYVGCNDGHLYALNAWSGDQMWDLEIGKAILSSPAIGADGVVYVGAEDGRLYAIG
jgi:outer membrane protein assembly factor BamB